MSSDKTGTIAARSCVVLAPHPDDETLGCGGAIALKRSHGTEVTVVIATTGGTGQPTELISSDDLAKLRRSEVLAACGILGVPKDRMVFWEYPTKDLGIHANEATARLIELLRELRPDDVYVTTALDDHRDHRALNEIARRAIADPAIDAQLLEYPVWFWSTMPWFPHLDVPSGWLGRTILQPLATIWNLRPIAADTRSVQDTKRAAIEAHRSQVHGLDDDPRWKLLPEHLLDRLLAPEELLFPAGHRSRYLSDHPTLEDVVGR